MMHTRFTTLATLALAAAFIAAPAAASAQGRIHGIARLGLEYGGDKIIEFEYEDGSTPDVTAGSGIVLTVGGGTQLAAIGRNALDAQLNAGLKWRTIPAATNQDANWLRFPVEGLLYFRMPSGFRLGAGATVHLSNVLKSSGAVLNERVEFKNNPGALLQAEYMRGNMVFDVRYTALEYESELGGTADASSIGVGFSFIFGRPAPATTSGSSTTR
jgi:hypothetical protein